MSSRLLLACLLAFAVHASQTATALTYTEDFSAGLGNWTLDPGSSPVTTLTHDAPNGWARSDAFFVLPPFYARIDNLVDTFEITQAGNTLTFDIDVDVQATTPGFGLEFYLLDPTDTIGVGFSYDLATGDITQLMGGTATGIVSPPLVFGAFRTASLELAFDGANITPTFRFGGETVVGDSSAFSAPQTMKARFGYTGSDSQIVLFDNIAITMVPEPSTALLVLGGATLLCAKRGRRPQGRVRARGGSL